MENNKKVQELLGVSMEKIREMADANTVVGNPITMPDGTVLLPVSKISYGFAAGGSDLPNKNQNELFGGGTGAGIHVTPVAFLVISGRRRMLTIVTKPDSTDKVVNLVPDLVDKVASLFSKKKEKTETTTVEAAGDEATVTVTETETKG